MEQLKKEIEHLIGTLSKEDHLLLQDDNLNECSKYPFNQYTNVFSVLFSRGVLSYDEYAKLRDEYFKRNPYLDLFELAPRTFGQTWGEDWLKAKNMGILVDPPKKDGFTSQYDLWLPLEDDDGIRIEVKASHVAAKDPDRILVEKGYKKPEGINAEKLISDMPFEMNFQQLKPSCCDVFVWLAVWMDYIDIWVIPASKIMMRPKGTPRRKSKDSIVQQNGVIYMGSQHQGGKGGDIPEGQIFVNNSHYKDLDCYKATLENLIDKIKEYGGYV